MKRENIPVDDLRRMIKADYLSGGLLWLERPEDLFPTAHSARLWNGRMAGREAFTTTEPNGYNSGRLFNRKYYAHRVIWALHYGEWPAEDIDHINGNRADNRITNLRAASRAENARNSRMKRNNRHGVSGVSKQQLSRSWMAEIMKDGKRHYLGTFPTKEEAAEAYESAKARMGFSDRHGLSDGTEAAP